MAPLLRSTYVVFAFWLFGSDLYTYEVKVILNAVENVTKHSQLFFQNKVLKWTENRGNLQVNSNRNNHIWTREIFDCCKNPWKKRVKNESFRNATHVKTEAKLFRRPKKLKSHFHTCSHQKDRGANLREFTLVKRGW